MEYEKNKLTQSQLKELLHYDKHTGLFTWKVARNNIVKIGSITGNRKTTLGYGNIRISFLGKSRLYSTHRLAWLYEFGEFPKKHLDHVNHDRLDNRICILREVDRIDNQRNQKIRSTNKSGLNGVYWHKNSKKWAAEICVNKTSIHLGYFKDKNEAIMDRLHANRLYKFHNNHGK